MVTTITEYFWGFDARYQLLAYQGTAVEEAIALHTRSGSVEIKTTQNTTPRPTSVMRSPLEVNITWLLVHLDGEGRAAFTIDRKHEDCHTPRRNDDIDKARAAFDELASWCAQVTAYFQNDLFPAQQDHGRDLSAIDDADVFVPVQPLFEGNQLEGEGALPAVYPNAFLAEEQRSLGEKCRALAKVFPRDATLITAVEAALLVTLMHVRKVCHQHADCVAYIEDLLRRQLIAAIGKEVTPADFTALHGVPSPQAGQADNVNPIEKVERSLMIVGSTIHAQPATAILADDQRERFLATTPQLGDGGDQVPQ